MKLRWVEREVPKFSGMATGDYRNIEKVKVLQYWENLNPFSTFDVAGSGRWVDVPLEVEE